jgi:phosphoribosylglycinamide formyltransferase-1
MLRVVVCVSGGGTNLQAIIDGVKEGSITGAKLVGVISNNPGVKSLERAANAGIPAFVVRPKDYSVRDDFHKAFMDKLAELQPDLIVLAGFLVRIPEEMCKVYPGKIINIHPSLIPSFAEWDTTDLKFTRRRWKEALRLPELRFIS